MATQEEENGGAATKAGAAPSAETTEEITVWGEGRRETNQSSPDSFLTREEVVAMTAVTTEDLVKYEPGVIIRRRFIGDANGTVGMRGSNMFQTTRTMVFADGIPLHYFLQTRFSGSPRWGLVNADELGFVEVVYGPFSAEYGGNAMGGVINIETRIPTSRRLHAEGSAFQQHFDADGFDDAVEGYKGFVSFGQKTGRVSLYGAVNRLQNLSQPQTFRFGSSGEPTGAERPVDGSLAGTDEYGDRVRYFGNTGPEDTRTSQFKLKLGYEMPRGWFALFNGGFEVRDIAGDRRQNYLVDASGEPVWDGAVVQDGVVFGVRGRDFNVSDLDRRSLLLGTRVQGGLGGAWFFEGSLSYFDVLEDESAVSLRNPRDPAFTPAGTIRDFEKAGWETAEVKVQNDRVADSERLSLLLGYRFEHYSLRLTNYDSIDYVARRKTSINNASGGDSDIHALYGQLGWRSERHWDVVFGARVESWSSEDGFFNNRGTLNRHLDRSERRVSPKLSLGYAPNGRWRLRLSLAQAYRFPIVEELFQNERRTNGTSIADADLEPEDGRHYNLLAERSLQGGFVRLNLFTETIDEVIFNQASIVDNRRISTFLPIDQVVTDGAELVYNQSFLADGGLSVRFNATWLDSQITRNTPNPELEGKMFPRMPEWRSHLLVNYGFGERWDVGGGVRYASDSFGDLDNRDTADGVFGAHDDYTQLSLRSGCQLSERLRLSVGVDNLTDQVSYVHHPWPGRTVFAEFAVDWR